MSSTPAIETTGLSKTYGTVRALSDLTLSIPAGQIYGLIGRNGAGKTTLMRLLLGLISPSEGSARLLGYNAGDPRALVSVGSLVESPALYPHLTGRDNLRLLAHYCRATPAHVESALEQVELGERADTKYSTYSLGMKQRLGVAAALLGDPRLLILDEPTNGLDPAAMAQLRELLRGLRDQGRTVLLSSHLLGELEQVCDRVGIVHEGQMVVEGTLAEIHAAAGASTRITVSVGQSARAISLLRGFAGVSGIEQVGDELEVVVDTATPATVNRMLVTAGIDVNELRVRRRSLEDVFLGLTEPDHADEYVRIEEPA